MDERLQDLLEAIGANDDLQTEQAARAAGQLGDAALPVLRDLLASERRDHRWWAARVLAAVGTPKATSCLIGALEDSDPDVRACAIVGLAGLQPPEALAPLIARLSDPSAYVARLAADALGQFGQPAAASLIVVLKEGDAAARAGAARALSAIQPEEAISALCAALDDPSTLVTYYAEEALEKMGVGLVLFKP
ncbi:MAG: HEAT repeat domain-containing protein [Anaerolineae bacterium]|jgi:HEAT repeat protein